MEKIFTTSTASISEFKANPMRIIAQAGGEPLAILNRNKPAFYCLAPDLYEMLLEKLDDMELLRLAQERADEPSFEVSLDEL